jgi:hypothetical protein
MTTKIVHREEKQVRRCADGGLAMSPPLSPDGTCFPFSNLKYAVYEREQHGCVCVAVNWRLLLCGGVVESGGMQTVSQMNLRLVHYPHPFPD